MSPIFSDVTILVAFGAVLVVQHSDWYVMVDVQVTSSSAKSASTQSQ